MRTIFCVTSSCCLGVMAALWSCAASGQIENPVVPARSESSAFSLTKASAESGDKEAQFKLGWMYERGELGAPQSKEEAFAWWLKAARQGEPFAQFNVAVDYQSGRGVGQNYNEAAYWFCKTAAPMDSHALFNLGLLYLGGRGVAKDYAKTTSLWEEARDRGYTLAKKELGFVETNYYYSHGTVLGNVQMKTNTPEGETALEGYQLANRWLAFESLTFTDKNGMRVENAKLVEVTPSSIFYMRADGVCCNEEKLSDLPADLQNHFSYNAQNAVAFEAGLQKSSLPAIPAAYPAIDRTNAQ